MTDKNYTEVTISGKTYTLGGPEDKEYLERVAAYINGKLDTLRETRGFARQTADFQNLMLLLNIADDYFKQKTLAEQLTDRLEMLEQETDDLKHRLVMEQMQKERQYDGKK